MFKRDMGNNSYKYSIPPTEVANGVMMVVYMGESLPYVVRPHLNIICINKKKY